MDLRRLRTFVAVVELGTVSKAALHLHLFKEGPGRERSITPEQVVALLGELPTHQRDVVVFALATGLRQSNVLGLEWWRVDLVAGHAWVCADQSKNRKPIAVSLNATALDVLRRQLGICGIAGHRGIVKPGRRRTSCSGWAAGAHR